MMRAKLSLEKSPARVHAAAQQGDQAVTQIAGEQRRAAEQQGPQTVQEAGHAEQRDGHKADVQIVPPRLCKLLLLLLDQTFIHGKAPLTERPDGALPQPGRCAEHGTARHQNISARFHALGRGGIVHAAVHFQQIVCAARFALCLEPAQLVQRRGHELLPAEAGLHAHHQHQIQLVEIRGQRFRISTGLDGQAHLAAQCLDRIDGLLDVVLALEVEVVQAGTRLMKGSAYCSGWLIIRWTS